MVNLGIIGALHIVVQQHLKHRDNVILLDYLNKNSRKLRIVIDRRIPAKRRCPCGKPNCGATAIVRVESY